VDAKSVPRQRHHQPFCSSIQKALRAQFIEQPAHLPQQHIADILAALLLLVQYNQGDGVWMREA
jgi:hypothetical protein